MTEAPRSFFFARYAGYGLLEISFVVILLLGVTLSLADLLRLYNGQRVANYAADSGLDFALSRYYKIQNNGFRSLDTSSQAIIIADLKFSTIAHVVEFIDVTGSIANLSCATVEQLKNGSKQGVITKLQGNCCELNSHSGCLEVLVGFPDEKGVEITLQRSVPLLMLDSFLGRYVAPKVRAASQGSTSYVSQSGRPNLQNNRP